MTTIEIKLTHTFLSTCHDLPALLKDCNKLTTFCSRLVKQSERFPDRYDPFKYRGDGFELFTEALIKLSSVDNYSIGIYDYQNSVADAPGVDGFGKSTRNGKPATVQCKYVGDHEKLLTASDGKNNLATLVSSSLLFYDVDKNDPNCMLIVTTASGLHHYTDEKMFDKKVRCLGWEQLKRLVDGNVAFWDQFRLLCS
jgi:hypothetical protein